MKNLITFFIIFISLTVNAKAGPPIPLPKQEIIEAVKIVRSHFYKEFPDGKRFTESKNFKIKDFIVTSVKYSNSYRKLVFKKYSWIIVFRHPIHNDHSFTYQLKPDGKVILLRQTE